MTDTFSFSFEKFCLKENSSNDKEDLNTIFEFYLIAVLIGLVQGGIIDDWSSIAIADLRYAYGVSISWRDSVRGIQGGDQPQALRNSAVQGKQKMRVGMAVVNKHGLDVVANNVQVRPMQTMGVQHV